MRVMSADSHMDLVYLPPDTFTSRLPAKWGDRVPHVVELDGQKVWVSGEDRLARFAYYGPGIAGGQRGKILAAEGFTSGQLRPSEPQLRRADQERDGVEAEVIYGLIGISRGLYGARGITDPELLRAVYHAYNDYIADFNRSMPGRFFGLGCLPNHDAKVAADEIHHCAELGLRGVIFLPWTAAMPVWHEMWEPMWAAAEETGLVLSFHVFEGGTTTVGYEIKGVKSLASTGAWLVVGPMQMDEILCSVILSGMLARHPRLKVVLGEAGIGWIPYVLERLDDTYKERLADDCPLALLPSEYFKRQVYATFQKDHYGVLAFAEIVPDNVMWGSDYPHRDGTWPFSQQAIEEQFRGVEPAIRQKMVYENAARLYRIEEA
jgi:predicted TIM-barrel fold metal-dependent hydrolase